MDGELKANVTAATARQSQEMIQEPIFNLVGHSGGVGGEVGLCLTVNVAPLHAYSSHDGPRPTTEG